jgi:hypothetical protein
MAKKTPSVIAGLLWIAAFLVVSWMLDSARNRRLNREMDACVRDYASARSKADTEQIDKRWVMPTHTVFSKDTTGFTCSIFRGVLPNSPQRP